MQALAKAFRSIGFGSTRPRSGAARVSVLASVVALIALGATPSPASAANPTISEQLPLDVTQTKATLRAKVNPEGKATSYHVEYGIGTAFDERIPADHELFLGSGTEPVIVSVSPADLQEDTAYSFRVVATNADGTTVGPDQPFSTLNDHGLPWGRRYELVSPPDKGPNGEAARSVNFGAEARPKPSWDGDEFAYVIGYGMPDSTSGGEVFYRASRDPGGWLSQQLTPPARERSEVDTDLNGTTWHEFFSKDLSCAFLGSSERLTDDPAAEPVIEAGRYNLYRRDPAGNYTLVTNQVPTNPAAEGPEPKNSLRLFGASENCDRIFFQSANTYPGVPTSGTNSSLSQHLYEWDEGVLRDPGIIPGPSGPEVAPKAEPGRGETGYHNAVSEDGSRLFFSAVRKVGVAGEVGQKAIFLREDAATGIDVSQSQTATPNDNASIYQTASNDANQIFFLGRYGLASNGTSTGLSSCATGTVDSETDLGGLGCDLYRFSVDTGTLTDVSADSNPEDTEGASVVGVLAAAPDGSSVYFATRGQLIAGEGNTETQNKAAPAYNVYRWDEGVTSYVMTLPESDFIEVSFFAQGTLLLSTPGDLSVNWSTQVTPGGDHLLFQSRANLTGYNSGGAPEAYMYSTASNEIVCVSCRRDGQPSKFETVFFSPQPPLIPPVSVNISFNEASREHPQISDDGSQVFFKSYDALAPGGVDGLTNLYEWRKGQISLLTSEPAGVSFLGRTELYRPSPDGDSVFFRTKQSLLPQDIDGRMDVYAARVGGGFPFTPPSDPCDPLAEGACEGAATPGVAPPAAPASAAFAGSGNVKSKPRPRCPKGRRQVKRKGKVRCLARKAKRTTSSNRTANTNRRAGK